MSVLRVVSGGQTGVDRAGLEAAVRLGLSYAGWCPRGGRAEDAPAPPGVRLRFPRLRETDEADPAVRTRLNVRDCDAVLVLRPAHVVSPGTHLTLVAAAATDRPLLVADPRDRRQVRAWLAGLEGDVTLDVAGPRESECPGIGATALHTLLDVLARRPDGADAGDRLTAREAP
ncbi:putative molybdenum carrier protein [Aeromicrobium sp. IC_218]|uniref:YpsA SLOG family protein n=1 Tax=Aeromicrobium sp. IC_218 TaxID=2545468 RepID=UPI0010401CEA|nr:putative molybdenum carrier protein [Aeromicrobium sp. IC_218]TCI97698.1 molybdenum cofactor carrier [Aeromicrobium sp. IC_218]